MPKNPLRPITCMAPGCGYLYKHKRLEGKGWKRERMAHVASGDCARRVNASVAKDQESRANGMSVEDIKSMVLTLQEPIYELLRVTRAELGDLKHRVEKRLESRKKRKFYIERDSKPKPWKMGTAVKDLLVLDLDVAEKFKETMTKEYTHGWSWEVSLATWFHWLLDQCSSDPILLMSKDEIRFHNGSGAQKVTKLQFFRCFGRFKEWDPLDEGLNSFFVGFWYPLVAACRRLTHWDNRIIFDLPCPEQRKRSFDMVWFNALEDEREPNLTRDKAIAQVFYDVLATRQRQRRAEAQDDEKKEE